MAPTLFPVHGQNHRTMLGLQSNFIGTSAVRKLPKKKKERRYYDIGHTVEPRKKTTKGGGVSFYSSYAKNGSSRNQSSRNPASI